VIQFHFFSVSFDGSIQEVDKFKGPDTECNLSVRDAWIWPGEVSSAATSVPPHPVISEAASFD
jgi:hypothetical protein